MNPHAVSFPSLSLTFLRGQIHSLIPYFARVSSFVRWARLQTGFYTNRHLQVIVFVLKHKSHCWDVYRWWKLVHRLYKSNQRDFYGEKYCICIKWIYDTYPLAVDIPSIEGILQKGVEGLLFDVCVGRSKMTEMLKVFLPFWCSFERECVSVRSLSWRVRISA